MNPLVESGSSLSVWRTCRKRYEFEYERKLSLKGYSSALGLGSMVHKFIEGFHLGVDPLILARQEAGAFMEKHPDHVTTVQEDLKKAIAMFNAWRDYWATVDSYSFAQKDLEFIDVEAEWAYPVNMGPDLVHAGKRDGYLKHKKLGKHFLYELKTAALGGEDNYIHRLKLDHQISANILALKKAGKPVDGVFYDVIFKPAIRLKKNETADEFVERYGQVMRDEPALYFKRVLVDRLPATLEEYERETVVQMSEINGGALRYRNTSACMKFGSLCPFFNLCMDPGVAELENEFTKRTNKFPELEDANGLTSKEAV